MIPSYGNQTIPRYTLGTKEMVAFSHIGISLKRQIFYEEGLYMLSVYALKCDMQWCFEEYSNSLFT